MKTIGVLVLTGGKGRRFGGQKKIFLTRDGHTFADYILRTFSGCGKIYLSVDKEEPYRSLGLPMITDLYPGCGPLGGIASALSVCQADALFVTACDMPFITREAIEAIITRYEEHGGIVLASDGQQIEPLFGIYPRTVLPEAQKMLAEGNYKTRALFERIGGTLVSVDNAAQILCNINTPEEYRQYILESAETTASPETPVSTSTQHREDPI